MQTEEKMPDETDVDDVISLYFRDVRPIALLTPEEEIELARQIQRGRKARQRLQRGDLTSEQRASLEAEVERGARALQLGQQIP